ncbi:MATE family efflux transporter [Cloacibacillus porcorum]|uniref:MATE family efflux transporter n=1 Tax=Cloacibacillus porcorum TaxID=1197717 RepID=UPI002587957C|nr:MATE family efflux transporter [Cloacibacillus porcorum]
MEKEAAKKVDLGTGSVGYLLFRLALPAITAQIINVLYNMVDRMYIGHMPDIGANALTGVGVTFPAITAISAFAALVSMGGAPRASIMLGRGDKDTAERILGNCTTALLIAAFLLTAVFLIYGKRILLMFGASRATIEYGWSYMRIYSLGTVFVQLSLGLNAFINTQGYARTGMLSVLIGAVCNIILDPLLMFGLHMGVQGAALATIISQGISAAWVVLFLTSDRSYLNIKRRYMKPRWDILAPALALGAAPFVMQSTESILNICFNTSLLKYGGDLAVGAMTIQGSVMQFSMFPLQGMTQGAQPIVSFNYGAGNIERVSAAFRTLLRACLVYSALIWAFCMFTPMLFITIFTKDAALTEYCVRSIRVYMAASLIFGAQIACQQTFIALGNSRTSLFLALLRKVFLLIPLIYILPNIFEDKVFAVLLAEPIADTIAVCTTVTMFYLSFRKLKREILLSRVLRNAARENRDESAQK